MKRVEITFPEENREEIKEALRPYDECPVFLEAERNERDFLRCELVQDSESVDSLIQDVREITEIDSGDLIIEILQQNALVEKGERQKPGSSQLSHYEMYRRAFNSATFDNSSWALVVLASIIAVIGLAIQNIIVVIGAMVIAPMLGPFISSSFGLVVGDKEIIEESMLHGVGSVLVSVLTAFVIGLMFEVSSNSLIQLITDPGFGTVPLSLAVGSASALAFSSQARETLAGVAVAIALVPPSAAAGLMLANFNLQIFFNVSTILISNTMSLVLAGSITFKLIGVEADTWYRRNISQEKLKKAFTITTASIILIAATVTYTSYKDLQITDTKTQIQETIQEEYGNDLLKQNVHVEEQKITVTAIVTETQTEKEQIHPKLEEYSDKTVKLKITELATTK